MPFLPAKVLIVVISPMQTAKKHEMKAMRISNKCSFKTRLLCYPSGVLSQGNSRLRPPCFKRPPKKGYKEKKRKERRRKEKPPKQDPKGNGAGVKGKGSQSIPPPPLPPTQHSWPSPSLASRWTKNILDRPLQPHSRFSANTTRSCPTKETPILAFIQS